MNGKWQTGIWMVMLCVAGCGQRAVSPEAVSASATAVREGAVVSGAAALDEVRQFVELGAKEPGTPEAEKAAAYLRGRLQAAGVEAQIQEFQDPTPVGNRVFRNVLGRIPGGDGKIVLIGAHYDTKVGIEGFVGANDSGSGTGLLIELAKALQQTAPHPMEIRLALFDGEEARVEYGPTDGFHGSRHLAGTLAADGSLSNVVAMILLDMVGDKDLTVTIPRNGTSWLMKMAFDAAHEEGVRKSFRLAEFAIDDDHTAFLARGVPAIDLIDFQYGSRPGKNDYWHTAQDTLDKVSAESLETVGRVVLRMLNEIARQTPTTKK